MVELKVKSNDPKVEAERKATCHRVLKHFQFDDPGKKLLCFIDDEDFAPLKPGRPTTDRVPNTLIQQNIRVLGHSIRGGSQEIRDSISDAVP